MGFLVIGEVTDGGDCWRGIISGAWGWLSSLARPLALESGLVLNVLIDPARGAFVDEARFAFILVGLAEIDFWR